MARYFKTGATSWNSANSWSATSAGGIDNAGVPTAADDVIFELLSGSCTIDVTPALCRSLDCTSGVSSYTGTITHNAATTLTIGDGTSGAGNVAFKLASGMTYTKGNTTTSAVTFASTSTTQQTVTLAGKTIGDTTFNGVAGSWLLSDALTGASVTATIVTLTNGILNTNGQTVTVGVMGGDNGNTRTLTLGASSIVLGNNTGWQMPTTTGLTFNANTSTITCNASGANFSGGGLTYNNVSMTGAATAILLGANTFANLSRIGTATATNILTTASNQTVTTLLTLTGNTAANRLAYVSTNIGTAVTLTAAAVSLTNVDFRDVTAANAIPFTGTSIGNALGNSNITFTPEVTRYWVGNGGNWTSTTKWSTDSNGASGASVPLPHDTVIIDEFSITSASQTIASNSQARLGADITFAGVLNSPTFSVSTNDIYGSFTFDSGIEFSGASTTAFRGRGAHTITSAGRTWTGGLSFTAPGGSYTLQDNLVSSATFTLANGTFNANNFNVTSATGVLGGTLTKVLNMGSGTWTLTGSGTVWNVTTGGTTVNGNTSTLVLTDTSSSGKTLSTGAFSLYNFVNTVAGTGGISITGGVTWNNFTVSGGTRSVTIPSSNTFNGTLLVTSGAGAIITLSLSGNITCNGDFRVNGVPGALGIIQSSAGGTRRTITRTVGKSLVSCNYLNIIDSGPTNGPWYAGAGSTDSGNNTGWIFSNAPRLPNNYQFVDVGDGMSVSERIR